MRNKKEMSWLLLVLYSLPFGFWALRGDAEIGTLLFYGVWVVSYVGLFWMTLKTGRPWTVLFGTGLSFLTSFLCVKYAALDAWAYYFKPFTPTSLLVAIYIAAGAIQAIGVYRYLKKKKQTSSDERK